MNIKPSIIAALAFSLLPLFASAQEPQAADKYEVVRDTIKYTTRPHIDTSDPMSHVVNNPSTPPKGSGGLSHIKAGGTQTADSGAGIQQQKPQPNYVTHVVRSGETLGKIAAKYHVSVNQLVKLNGLKSPDRLSVGQKLKIKTA